MIIIIKQLVLISDDQDTLTAPRLLNTEYNLYVFVFNHLLGIKGGLDAICDDFQVERLSNEPEKWHRNEICYVNKRLVFTKIPLFFWLRSYVVTTADEPKFVYCAGNKI